MTVVPRHALLLVAAVLLLLAGIVPGAGQAALPAPAEAPRPPAMPGQNPVTVGPAKPGASPSSTLQTKTAPRTPTASGLGPSSPPATGRASPAPAPAENAVRIVRLYRGPGRFDEKLAGQLRLALQKAFNTEEPDSKNQHAAGSGSPAGPEPAPGRIAQNHPKAD